MTEVKIHQIKEVNLKGSTLIAGFPSVGLVSTIISNYLIETFEMELIAVIDSDLFPPMSLVKNGVPNYPLRIYAGEHACRGDICDQLVVCISEFHPPVALIKPIAESIFNWAEANMCDVIIAPEGLVVGGEAKDADDLSSHIFYIGNCSPNCSKEVSMLFERPGELGLEPFMNGVINGVSGELLNLGTLRDFSVLNLLVGSHKELPDARAAAKVIEVIDKLVLGIDIDAEPLYVSAERMESQIESYNKQLVSSGEPSETPHIAGYS